MDCSAIFFSYPAKGYIIYFEETLPFSAGWLARAVGLEPKRETTAVEGRGEQEITTWSVDVLAVSFFVRKFGSLEHQVLFKSVGMRF